jgi:uncharacterized protein YdeI (YjbR/CyaY-like superfamily)
MGTTDPRVDAYIEKSADFARPILKRLRKLIHAACEDVEETMKWSFPHFMYGGGILCSMAAFKEHASFGFWKSSLMKSLGTSKKSDQAMGQYGRITSLADLPDDQVILKQVKEAAHLNEQGVKAPRDKSKPKKPLKIPRYLGLALKRNAKALATFESFSPSHQREYIEWITEAKTEATRQKRVDTALEWLAEGKSRNWKYERPR